MLSERKNAALGILTAANGLSIASLAQAGEITQSSADGTVNTIGECVDTQDNAYVISTALGELRVAESRVSCSGASCPSFSAVETDITTAGSDVVASGLMPLLLEGYAGALDAAASLGNTGQNGELITTLAADHGFGVDRRAQSPDSSRVVGLLDPSADAYKAGFTDDVGQFDGNRVLSEQRVPQVSQELVSYAGISFD